MPTRLFLAVCSFLVVLPSLPAQTPDIIAIPLHWQAVKGAGGYRVEVQDGAGQITFSQDLTDTSTTISLQPGSYQLRVSTLNRFGKPEAGTPWTPLVIKPIPQPVIEKVEPAQVQEDEPVTLTVANNGEDAKTKWELIPAQGGPLTLTATASGDNWNLPVPALSQGSYTLRATGKTGKVGELTSALTVVAHEPVVAIWTLVPADQTHPLQIQLTGKYLYPGSRVVFSRPGAAAQEFTFPAGGELTSVTVGAPTEAGAYTVATARTAAGKTIGQTLTILPVPVLTGILAGSSVTLPLTQASPGLRVFVLYGGQRHEISDLNQGSEQLSFSLPEELRTPGTYPLWVVNAQGRESALTEGLTVKADGSVQGSSAAVAAKADKDFSQARVDDGAWTTLPHTFDGLEAGKTYRVTFQNLSNQFLSSPDVTLALSPHETRDLTATFTVGSITLRFNDLPTDARVLVNQKTVDTSAFLDKSLSVEAGDVALEVHSSAGQIWTRSLIVEPGATIENPLDSFVAVVPQRSIDLGSTDDWEGLAPIFAPTGQEQASDPGSHLKAIWFARDAASLYVRLDLDGEPVPTISYWLSLSTKDRIEFRTEFLKGQWSTALVNTKTGKAVGAALAKALKTGLQLRVPLDSLKQVGLNEAISVTATYSVATRLSPTNRLGIIQRGLPFSEILQIAPWTEPAPPTVPTVSTLAGGFANPAGVAVDSQGNVYVADTSKNSILKVTADGSVTTFAGSGKPGEGDGNGTTATFDHPGAIAFGPDGSLYVAETVHFLIRKISPQGVVSTFAGSGATGGYGGKNSEVRPSFDLPGALAVDRFGNVYLVDLPNDPAPMRFRVWRISANGQTTMLADQAINRWIDNVDNFKTRDGSWSTPVHGSGNAIGIAIRGGFLLVSYSSTHQVLKIDLGGHEEVSAIDITPAGVLNLPTYLAVDLSGDLYITDSATNQIDRITSSGVLTVIAGTGQAGSTNGPGQAASFDRLNGIAVRTDGLIYVADSLNQKIRKITLPQETKGETKALMTTLVPSGTLNSAKALQLGADGTLYGIDGNRIFARKPSGEISFVAGTEDQGLVDSEAGVTAQFRFPEALAVDSENTIYVADTGNSKIRSIGPNGVTTFSGNWNRPRGILVSPDGSIYVSDTGNHRILRYRSYKLGGDATWKVFAGPKQVSEPGSLAMDRHGNLYVGDGNQISEINPDGQVAVLAGSARGGIFDDVGSRAALSLPRGLAIDQHENLVFVDGGSDQIRWVTPGGKVTTLPGWSIQTEGASKNVRQVLVSGMALSPDGSFIFADGGDHSLNRLQLPPP